MGVIIRQSLQTSLVSYLGMAIGAFNLVWLSPKFLLPEEIGLIRVVQDIAIVFVGLTHLGTLSITDRLFPYFRNHEEKHHGLLSLTLVIYFLFFVFYCLSVLIFKDTILGFYQKHSPRIGLYFHYTIPLTFFMLYQLALDAYARAHFRIVMSGLLREIFLRVMMSLLICLYFLRYLNFDQFMSGLVGTYGVIVGFLLIYLFRLKILYLNVDLRRVNVKFLKDIALFYSYVILVGFHRMVISRIDILMIPALLGTKATGIYSISLFLGAMIDIPCRAVNQISTPIIAQAWADNDLTSIQEVYQKTAMHQFIVGSLLFLGVWCNVDNIFHLMPKGDIYQSGKYVVLFIGLTRLIEMAAGASEVIILHSQYYRFNTILIILLAVLVFLTNLIFIPLYHITGAAMATALSMLLYTLIKFGFLWQKFRLQPFTKNSLWVILVTGMLLLLIQHVPTFHIVLLDILMRSILITVLFVGFIMLLKVSEEMNQLIYHTVKKYMPLRA